MDVTALDFPPVTAVLLASTAVVTLPVLLLQWPYYYVLLLWPQVVYKFQIWRVFTNVFYGGGGFPLIFDFFLLFRTSTSLEAGHIGDTASYVWTLLVVYSTILILNLLPIFSRFILFRPMLTAMLYLWSKENPTAKISLFGLVSVPARLYPFVLILLDLIQNGPGAALGAVMGILAGHLWWFISTYLPLQAPTRLRRTNPLRVPRWYRNLWPRRRQTAGSGGPAPVSIATGVTGNDYRSQAATEARHRWGSGQRLGGNGL